MHIEKKQGEPPTSPALHKLLIFITGPDLLLPHVVPSLVAMHQTFDATQNKGCGANMLQECISRRTLELFRGGSNWPVDQELALRKVNHKSR